MNVDRVPIFSSVSQSSSVFFQEGEFDFENPERFFLSFLQRAIVPDEDKDGFNFVEFEQHFMHFLAYLQSNPSSRMTELCSRVQERLHLSEIREIIQLQRKALDAGFPALLHNTKALRFSVESKLLYRMQMYKNSKETLLNNDIDVKLDQDGNVLFKKEGKFVPFSEIERDIVFSKEEGKFLGWNFIHPDGFVPKDSCSFERPYPIAKLSPEALQKVQEQAQKFKPVVVGDKRRDFVFQIITAGNQYTANPLLKNVSEWLPEHASLRVITSDGDVYSCGTKMDKKDEDVILTIPQFLSTRLTKAPVPDYAESYSYTERRVTSIPVTQEDAEKVLSFVGDVSKGIPFCFPLQNCTRTVAAAAALVGESIDVKISAPSIVWNCLPSFFDIPYVGNFLKQLVSKVFEVCAPIFSALSVPYAILPEFLKSVVRFPLDLHQEIFRKIGAIIVNIGTIFFGSLTPLPEEQKKRLATVPKGLEWFDRLLHPEDVFKEDAIQVFHSAKLRKWQLEQPSTVVYRDSEISLFV